MDKEELDLEALKVWADLCKGKAGSGIKGKCCFCGKEFLGYGHDPRPIKVAGEENARCCAECNARIVGATREAVWGAEAEKDREIKALKAEMDGLRKEHTEAKRAAYKAIARRDRALELACLEFMGDLKFESEEDKYYALCQNMEYFRAMVREEGGQNNDVRG